MCCVDFCTEPKLDDAFGFDRVECGGPLRISQIKVYVAVILLRRRMVLSSEPVPCAHFSVLQLLHPAHASTMVFSIGKYDPVKMNFRAVGVMPSAMIFGNLK